MMNEGINFSTQNFQKNFVTNRPQLNRPDSVSDVLNNIQQTAVKNANEFINQSAKSLYQFFANMQAANMNSSEMSLILKDLLGMQKDIALFLTNLNGDKSIQALLQQMTKSDIATLLMNSQMDLTKLMQFMEQNGKDALSKLFNMTANYSQSGVVAGNSQITELIAILNACTPNSETNQMQVLKNMMLLYLPWLPLGEQNFSIEIGKKGSEEGGEDGEDVVTILISTVNFGNVHVSIFKTEKSTINFHISAGDKFPKEKILSKLNSEAQEYNVQTVMAFEKKEVLNQNVRADAAKTQVSVNTTRHVNPFLILIAQSTVRIIIETDKNFSLVEKRKEKI